MFCPNCGASVNDGTAFCSSCGAKLSSGANPQPTQQPQGGYQQNSYQQNGYQQNGYQQNSYQQNGYQQGGYQQGGYQQGGYQQGGFRQGGGYRSNHPRRSIAACIILSIVTCGIYGIVWMINMVNDLNTASGHPSDSSGGTVFLLNLVTCGIYGWYWMYKAGDKVNEIRQRNGEFPDQNAGLTYLLLSFFGLGMVTYCLIQNELNKVAAL